MDGIDHHPAETPMEWLRSFLHGEEPQHPDDQHERMMARQALAGLMERDTLLAVHDENASLRRERDALVDLCGRQARKIEHGCTNQSCAICDWDHE